MRVPFPSVNFPKHIRAAMNLGDVPSQIFSYEKSGEVTASIINQPLGVVMEDGVLTDFIVGLNVCGRDDTDALTTTVNLKKNGTTVLSSTLDIDGTSGEAASRAFTEDPTFAVTSVERGDILTLDAVLTRTTPDTEINHLCAAVKIVPVRL